MGDWQELGQTALIGLVFAFLVSKLISVVVSFREGNLKLVREASPSDAAGSTGADEKRDQGLSTEEEEEEDLLGEGGSDDSDWEGIDSTELDEEFSAAAAFVAAAAGGGGADKVSPEKQLQLYGLYKISTEGPCTAPQPSALKMTARAKWNAWQKLGSMPQEEAMQKYIMIVNELYPSWSSGSQVKKNIEDIPASSSGAKGPMGPVFSSYAIEEDSGNELNLEPIHVSAREGRADELLNHLANGLAVDLRDSEGRTPLLWAVDRGHLNVVEVLLNKNADVNAKDNEGQTALHYAVICEREAIAELLVRHHADCNVKDDDGNSPLDLCDSEWAFMTSQK